MSAERDIWTDKVDTQDLLFLPKIAYLGKNPLGFLDEN